MTVVIFCSFFHPWIPGEDRGTKTKTCCLLKDNLQKAGSQKQPLVINTWYLRIISH